MKLPDTRHLGFRQIELPDDLLRRGIYGPYNSLVPWGAIALLRSSSGALTERSGIRFDASVDDLDALEVALLELIPSGQRVALVEHEHALVPGVEVHANLAARGGYARVGALLAALSTALHLEPEDLTWQVAD